MLGIRGLDLDMNMICNLIAVHAEVLHMASLMVRNESGTTSGHCASCPEEAQEGGVVLLTASTLRETAGRR